MRLSKMRNLIVLCAMLMLTSACATTRLGGPNPIGPAQRPNDSTFYVLNYGAKCDGVTDDSVAIQAALTAAAASCTYANNFATGTSVVAFPGKNAVCKINTGLVRSNCVSIEGNQAT